MSRDLEDEVTVKEFDDSDDDDESGCEGIAAQAYEGQGKQVGEKNLDDDHEDDGINGPEASAIISDAVKGPLLRSACSRIMREGRAEDASAARIAAGMSAEERDALHSYLEARIKQGLPAGGNADTAEGAIRKICFNRSNDYLRDMTVAEARALQAVLKPKN